MTQLRSFDRVAHVYDETRGLPPEVERAVADGLAAAIADVSAAPRVLEVGIGTGRIAVPLAGRGVRFAGVDIARNMLDRLLEKTREIDVALAESTRLPFRTGAFDAALFVHILHLVPDVEATVRAAVDCVRPGGLVLHGGDDPRDSIRDRAEIIIREAAAPYTGGATVAWRPYSESDAILTRVLQQAAVATERRTLATWTSRTSARKMLGRLERRDFSSSWLITDEALPKVLAAASAELETLFGGLDVEHEYPRSFSVLIARLPAEE